MEHKLKIPLKIGNVEHKVLDLKIKGVAAFDSVYEIIDLITNAMQKDAMNSASSGEKNSQPDPKKSMQISSDDLFSLAVVILGRRVFYSKILGLFDKYSRFSSKDLENLDEKEMAPLAKAVTKAFLHDEFVVGMS